MSKELTEQWRNGTLPVGHYYCKLYYNGFKEKIQECVKSAYSLKSCIPMSCGCEGEEVLAPVPTYKEYLKLESDSLAKQEGVELVAELENAIGSQADYFRQQISVLEDRVKELEIQIGAYESCLALMPDSFEGVEK